MWPFTRRTSDLPRSWKHRVEDLEDDLQHLERRFEKLRGQLTGGMRRPRDLTATAANEVRPDPAANEVRPDPELELLPDDSPDPYRALGAQLRFGKGGE